MLFSPSMEDANSPARRRRHDRSEVPVSFLPQGNPAARWAYLFALVGLIPPFGAVCGPFAFVLGMVGLRTARRDPEYGGLGHAFMSRALGLVEFLTGVGGIACLARAMELI